MRALEVSQLSFGYGADPLFSGVTFALEQGERAAIVAPNGAGKSTLLRVIAGEIAPDRGAVVRAKGASLAYFRQSHELAAAGSVRDAFLAGFADVVAARAALEAAQRGAASGTDEALAELSRATDAYHLAGGDELEHRIERIASHLGFRPADMDRPVESLSGGERGRLSLGVVLAREADLLLLDEPTNHLDLETTEWLERHLRGLGATVIVVSHDRAFLDATCPTTLELGRRGLRVYPLSYGAYEAARLEDLERERAVAERQEAFVAKTEDFIRKNIAGQKTKQAQSRRKMLDKLERVERPEDVWARADRVRFRFADCARSGDVVLEAEGLGASRGGRELFAGLDLRVKRGERVAIVGRNGAGKTTLLRRLAGIASGLPDEERPPSAGGGVSRAEDAGEVRRGAALREGYFDQHLGSVDPARTGVEEIRTVRGDLNADGAREYLARFGFTGDDPLRRVSGYSGGERSRLALAKLLLEPRNLLFLDEPTNHLDIPATRILEEALVGFEGTVVFVSHDRRFLENVATRVVVVDGEVGGAKHGPRGALVWPGTFRDWVEARARQGAEEERAEARPRARPSERPRGPAQPEAASARAPESPRPEKRVKRSASTAPPAGDAADEAARRRSFEADRAAARARERKERRVRELEAEIAKGEGELAARREELKGDPGGDWEALARKAQEERSLAARVDAMMSEWARLSEELGAAR